jgi:MFS family permease
MVFSLLPIFIVEELGGSSASFGVLEGAVVFISFLAKVFAGFVMDAFKRKLPMLRVGTALTVCGKLFLACAPNVFFVFIAKSLDRFASGLRQASSTAMLAGVEMPHGFVFSLRYTMNLSGFLIGSLITSSAVHFAGASYRSIFIASVIPTIIALFILQKKIKCDGEYEAKEERKWDIKDIALLPREYWTFMVVAILLLFNRFSEGFITLKAKSVLPGHTELLPVFMSIYEVCGACVAIPIGRLFDKADRKKVLTFGIILLVVADIFGMFSNSLYSVVLIYIFAGLHMGATQGIMAAIIARAAPQRLIGTAFAVFYMVEGLTVFCANVVAGRSSGLAEIIGISEASGPFIIGSIASILAVFALRIFTSRGV